jgi:DNA repair protein RadC
MDMRRKMSEVKLEALALKIEKELLKANDNGFGKPYSLSPEILYGLPKSLTRPPKVRLVYARKKGAKIKVTKSEDAVPVLRSIIGSDITVREQAILLLLDRANQITGYFKVSEGGMSATVIDTKLVVGAALQFHASGVILSHNHPSGLLKASEADIQITKKIQNALKLMDLALLDHIIVTQEGHYSFADEGLL